MVEMNTETFTVVVQLNPTYVVKFAFDEEGFDQLECIYLIIKMPRFPMLIVLSS